MSTTFRRSIASSRRAVEKSRLHIPLIFIADVLHGYRIVYPVPLGMAASFDIKMIEEVQGKAAFEARTAGQRWNASPMFDIARDPRWGRIIGGAGEDPYLGSKVATAQACAGSKDIVLSTRIT